MTLISAKIEVPVLHCTQQFDDTHGNSEPYLWFAYIFSDITTANTQQPISVFVPLVSNTRALFPGNVGNNQDVPIPPEIGTFQVNLDSGRLDPPRVLLGVFIVLLEQDDTSDEAIAAGYDAFRDAVRREANNFALTHPDTPPSPDDINQIADAIKKSVLDAIASKIGIEHLWENEDDYIGNTHALFLGPFLSPGPTPKTIPIVFDPTTIEQDAFRVVFDSFNPLVWRLVKAGHQNYQLMNATLSLQAAIDPCANEQEAFSAATANLKALRDQLDRLLIQLETAPPAKRQAIRKQISELRGVKIPLAQKAVEATLLTLRSCRLQVGRGGGVNEGAATRRARRAHR